MAFTVYPNAIDTSAQLPTVFDNITPVTSDLYNAQRAAIIAIESELGIKPSGTYGTVKDRLDAIISGIAGTSIDGDVTGSLLSSTVVKINGASVPVPGAVGSILTVISPGVLGYAVSGGIPDLNGDVIGGIESNSVISITGAAGIVSISPSGNIITWNSLTTSPGITQSANATNGATGQTLTIQSQNNTGTTSTGGGLILASGSGTSASGAISLRTGSTARLTITASGVIAITNLSTGIVHSNSSGNLTSSTIVNADVSSSAAIGGTKISPNFGTQNILTTGSITGSSLVVSALSVGVLHSDVFGNITSSSVVNADIPSGSLDVIKLITGLNGQALLSDGSMSVWSQITDNYIANLANISYSKLNLFGQILGTDISSSAQIPGSVLAIDGYIKNQNISSSAAISYSKLNLLDSILGTDINSNAQISGNALALDGYIQNRHIATLAGILYSKLSLSNSILNSDINNSTVIDGYKISSATSSVLGVIELNTDLGGTATAPQVVGLRGKQIANEVPIDGYALVFDSGSNSYRTGLPAFGSGGGDGGSTGPATDLVYGSIKLNGDIDPTSFASAPTIRSLTGKDGYISILSTAPKVSWTSNTTLPILTQDATTIAQAVGQAFRISSQPSTNDGYGGNLILESGSGGTNPNNFDGYVAIRHGNLLSTPFGLLIKKDNTVQMQKYGTGLAHIDSSGNISSSLVVDADISGTITSTHLPSATTGAVGLIKLANDLGGTALLPTVISATGAAGILSLAITAANIQWATATVAPTISQADNTTNSATAETLTIQAPNATGTSATGGAVIVKSGTGTTAAGALTFKTGSTTRFNISAAGAYTFGTLSTGIGHFDSSGILTSSAIVNADIDVAAAIAGTKIQSADTSNLGVIKLAQDLAGTALLPTVVSLTGAAGSLPIASTGASIAWAIATSNPSLIQSDNTTNGATGQTLTVHAQNTTGTTSTGGTLDFRSGTGTSASGAITMRTGSSIRLTVNATGVITIGNLSTGIVHSDSSGNLTSSLIVNADVNAAAAIAGTKISPNFGSQDISTTGNISANGVLSGASLFLGDIDNGVLHSSSGTISGSQIVNADVSSSAAIAGTKISPAFGTQNVSATGSYTASSADGYQSVLTSKSLTASNAGSGFGQLFTLRGADATQTNRDGGSITIQPGVHNGTASDGYIQIVYPSSNTTQAIKIDPGNNLTTINTGLFVSASGMTVTGSTALAAATIGGLTYGINEPPMRISQSLVSNHINYIDSTSGSFTLTLPAGSQGGLELTIKDVGGKLSTNPVTISSGGGTIEGSATSYVMNKNFETVTFIARLLGNSWTILNGGSTFDGYSNLKTVLSPGALTNTQLSGIDGYSFTIQGAAGFSHGKGGNIFLTPGLANLSATDGYVGITDGYSNQIATFSKNQITFSQPFAATATNTFNNTAFTGSLTVAGGFYGQTKLTGNADYVADAVPPSDYQIFAQFTSSHTITMPGHIQNRVIKIKDIVGSLSSTVTMTIVRNGGTGNIEGVASSYVVIAPYASLEFTSDGSNWWITQH